MQTEILKIRLKPETKEYAKYLAEQLGLNISEFTRMLISERINTMKQSMTSEEFSLVERNIIQAKKNNGLLKRLTDYNEG